MSTHEFIARVHEEGDGKYWAEVLDLPGCFASGDTLDELREALREAITLYLHDEPGTTPAVDPATLEVPVSREIEIDEIRVKVSA